MRCRSCDVRLTSREDSARYYGTTDRIGLCSGCLSEIQDDLVSPPVFNYRLPDIDGEVSDASDL